ncbi:PaaI family thioesterase [Actinopolymorpha alba]|uniref:PaaI family thioesterase n=1 Tax=Actinopolymorpha alba TaxID=533267 RepID=UPI00037CE2FF|nr:PaaI family thioesterase [Actinopolymorpha alba]
MTERSHEPSLDPSLPADPEALLALGRELLVAQPFSVLVGASLDAFKPGYAELSLPLTPQLLQQFGQAHGGVLSYLADNAMTFAGGSVLGPSVVTAGYTINYLRPAFGPRLVATAYVVNAGQRLAVTRCEILSLGEEREVECAVAQGTIATLNGRPERGSASVRDPRAGS